MEDMPTIIISVVVGLIILAVGVFAFFYTDSEVGYSQTQTEDFTVSDPTVDKECETQWSIDSVTSIHQYNGYTWVTVGASDYTVHAQSVTVKASGMQG